MNQRIFKEAGNFEGLTPQEKAQLAGIQDPDLRNTVGGTLTNLRRRGKNVDVKNVANQLLQVPAFRNNAELQRFSTSFFAQSKSPEDVNAALSVGSSGQAPLPSNFRPGTTQLQPANKTANVTKVSNVSPPPTDLHQRVTGNLPQVQQKEGEFEKQLRMRKERNTKGQIKEFINPIAAMGGALKNITSVIARLKPEELAAVASMINGLMQNSNNRGGNTMMATENKKMLTEVLKRQIIEQIQTKRTVERILSEGPLDSIWSKIKSAGSAVGQKMGLGGQLGRDANMAGARDQTNQMVQDLTKLIGKVNQNRQKFNSSILKNSQIVNSYHELVSGLVDAYQQSQHQLGPAGPQITRQIQDAVGNFVYDLKSEKEQIDMFLKQLQDAGSAKVGGSAQINKQQGTMDPTLLGAASKKRAEVARLDDQSHIGPNAANSFNRNAPGGKLGPEDLNKTKDSILNRAKGAKTEQERVAAMNDLQNLFMRQINREKGDKKKAPAKKKSPAKKSSKK